MDICSSQKKVNQNGKWKETHSSKNWQIYKINFNGLKIQLNYKKLMRNQELLHQKDLLKC